ncbi:DivIVA domain-containing protein [Deinococcus arenicola]|uniref:DivIVA domain-containing protein n=1 Tax=Deinococcus arenicola TaxID=2994950 RepID=A0ABU4DLP0_9DEIO|nr:DivIVA domain-containing protein [Deinococcus sp. ZS9-10]MDV6373352.1 DivIVA domain-containing protein [Deinococcus sp. ZS9-10]
MTDSRTDLPQAVYSDLTAGTTARRDSGKLTPLDIRHREFAGRWLGGYNRDSVRLFLAQVADDLEGLLGEQLREREARNRLEREVDELRASQDAIRRAVVAAEKMSHDLRASATRESELLVAQATAQGEGLLRESQSRNVEMEAQYGARMTALEATFHARFADLERDHHQLLLERERVQTERINTLEREFNERNNEYVSRLTGARQEYVQFLGGYRALMASFSELSARHVLPEDRPLPTSGLPGQQLKTQGNKLPSTADSGAQKDTVKDTDLLDGHQFL